MAVDPAHHSAAAGNGTRPTTAARAVRVRYAEAPGFEPGRGFEPPTALAVPRTDVRGGAPASVTSRPYAGAPLLTSPNCNHDCNCPGPAKDPIFTVVDPADTYQTTDTTFASAIARSELTSSERTAKAVETTAASNGSGSWSDTASKCGHIRSSNGSTRTVVSGSTSTVRTNSYAGRGTARAPRFRVAAIHSSGTVQADTRIPSDSSAEPNACSATGVSLCGATRYQ